VITDVLVPLTVTVAADRAAPSELRILPDTVFKKPLRADAEKKINDNTIKRWEADIVLKEREERIFRKNKTDLRSSNRLINLILAFKN
jgi:hypothetical protein